MRFNVAPAARTALVAALTAGLFALLAWAGVSLAANGERIAPLWLPNALLMGVLVRDRRGRLAVVALSCLLVNAAVNLGLGVPPVRSVAFSVANAGEALAAAWMLRRWCGRSPDLIDLGDFGRFCVVAGLAAPALSGTAAAAVLSLDGSGGGFEGWFIWAATDALGLLIGAPITIAVIDWWRGRRWRGWREAAEAAAVLAAGWAAVAAVFAQSSYPLLFLAGPFVLLAAFRLRTPGVALFVAGVTLIGTAATASGSGPVALVGGGPVFKLLILQLFLATTFTLGLPVNSVLTRLSHTRDELALLAANATDAVFRLALDGTCRYASPSVREILHVEPALLVGNSMLDRFHPDEDAAVRAAFAGLAAGETDRALIRYRSRPLGGADWKWLEANCGLVRDPGTGTPQELIVSIRDVSARKAMEDELALARDGAEAAARAKAEFLAHMSHEIRTPMNGVLGFAQLLLAGDLLPEQREQARMIADSGRAMMRLLNDILDLSKMEAGRMTDDPRPTDIRHAARGCLQLMVPSAMGRAVELRCEFDEDVPSLLLLDDLRFRQVMLNLLGNAVKFTANGEVAVRGRMADPDRVVIDVRDTGVGIPADRLRAIFDPFSQADAGTARRFGGTGLGLTISSQLAELMGGALSVESVEGEGSCFTLTLPARAPENAVPSKPAPEPQARPHGASRVLLAEDHEINQALVTAMLEGLGCRVELACDGVEAVAALSGAGDDPFDLVLMDVQMPGMDGLEATRLARAQGFAPPELPIVALTANAYPEDVAACLKAGMQGHIAKPLKMADLADIVARWTEPRGLAA